MTTELTRHMKPPRAPCAHKTYRLTCDQYEALRVYAGDRCQLCRAGAAETTHGFLVIDHDPAVGRWAVRGLLCSSCNTRLPYMQADQPQLSDYLGFPWYRKMLGDLGLSAEMPQEPPLGARVRCGQRRWLRERIGWVAQDGYRPGKAVMSWRQLHHRYGPHNCVVVTEWTSQHPEAAATDHEMGTAMEIDDPMSAGDLKECPVCFALVRPNRTDDHEVWHDGGRGRMVREARRLLRHLTEVSAAVVAHERDATDWTLLLGVEPEQSHLRVLQRVQEITAQEGIPLLNLTGRTTDVVVADASKVRSAAHSGEITIGDYTFTDAVPVSAEESS